MSKKIIIAFFVTVLILLLGWAGIQYKNSHGKVGTPADVCTKPTLAECLNQ